MNHIEMETRVVAPVDHVWAYLCDPSHMDDWSMGKWDFSGPSDQVGTTLIQTGRMMGFAQVERSPILPAVAYIQQS